MRSRIEEDDTITIVEDLVADDPGKASLDAEDALSATLRNLVVQDDCIAALLTSIRNISLVIGTDNVLLDVRVRRLDQKDALSVI